MAKPTSTLAQRLIQSRTASGMSQSEVAAAIGIAQASYSSLERGISKRTCYIGSLSHVLGVDAYWLETGKEHTPRRGVAEARADYTIPADTRRLIQAVEKLGDRKRKALLDLLGD